MPLFRRPGFSSRRPSASSACCLALGLIFVLTHAACSGDGAGAGASAADGGPGNGGTEADGGAADGGPTCSLTGQKDQATSWALPTLSSINAQNDRFMRTGDDLGCTSGGYARHATLDMNGDGRPDLVVTDDCKVGGLGKGQWDVYLNTGSGFASEATVWALPPLPSINAQNDRFMRTGDDLGCTSGGYARHATLDMNGDGRPDLVVTDDCKVGGLGKGQWDVYLNTGSGFASDATVWSLPTLPSINAQNDRFMRTGDDLGCTSGGYARHATLDMNGDGRPDLVVTDDCKVGGLGTGRWDVYLNTGSGFAGEATVWSLPTLPSINAQNDRFMRTGDDLGCTSGGYARHATLDMNGDKRPDLVVTDDCKVGGLGTGRWDVYLNTGSGFAGEATGWLLPTLPSINAQNDRFMRTGDDLGCTSGGYARHTTLDMNGDGRPDLVVTDDCKVGGLGTGQWDVYLNTGSGFAGEATVWALPALPSINAQNDRLMRTGDDLGCTSGGYARHALIDIDGDSFPDLVLTDDCKVGGQGAARWDVYLHACSP